MISGFFLFIYVSVSVEVVPRSENFHKSLFTIHLRYMYVISNLLGNIDTPNQPTYRRRTRGFKRAVAPRSDRRSAMGIINNYARMLTFIFIEACCDWWAVQCHAVPAHHAVEAAPPRLQGLSRVA